MCFPPDPPMKRCSQTPLLNGSSVLFKKSYFLIPSLQKNVISFGDSHVEREAVRAVTRGLPNTKTKSVKFAEKPSLEQLRRQLELVTNCFQYIHSHEGDLDLQLTVTVNTHRKPEPSKDSAIDVSEKNVVGSGAMKPEKEAGSEMVVS